jgi:hypothetical protein
VWVNPKHREHRDANTRASTPVDNGHPIATLPRGPAAELRITISEFNGKLSVALRVWEAAHGNGFWPTKKGLNLRANELDAAIEALQGARQLLDSGFSMPAPRPDPGQGGDRPDEQEEGPITGSYVNPQATYVEKRGRPQPRQFDPAPLRGAMKRPERFDEFDGHGG